MICFDKITEIYSIVDEFCQNFDRQTSSFLLGNKPNPVNSATFFASTSREKRRKTIRNFSSEILAQKKILITHSSIVSYAKIDFT